MKRIFTLAVLAAFCIGAVSCHRDKTPKISIFCDHIETIARQEGISFAEAATRVREIGYAGADIRVFQGEDRIRALAHACAITDIDYSKGDQKELEDQTLAFMDEKGFDRLLLVTGLMPNGFPLKEREAARKRIADFAKRVADKGYTIMVEDYDNSRSLCYNRERIDTIFAVSKEMGLVFDSGNFLFAGQDAMECLEHFRGRIGHVHLKDRVSHSNLACVPVGTGCIPIADIIRTLKDSRYKGWYAVEQYGSRKMLEDSAVSYANVLDALTLKK